MADKEMMQQKWKVAFKLLDFNKDGRLSSADKDGCIQSFINMFKPAAQGEMQTALDEFWTKSLFMDKTPDWGGVSMDVDAFVASRGEMFWTDTAKIIKLTREAIGALVRAADVNKAGEFSKEEFKKLHIAFGVPDENFINTVFQAITGREDGSCPADALVEFYTELTIGQDKEKHAAAMSAFSAVGML